MTFEVSERSAIQLTGTEVKSNYSTIAGIPGTVAAESLLVFRHAVYRSVYVELQSSAMLTAQ